jgi:hypothetical protein
VYGLEDSSASSSAISETNRCPNNTPCLTGGYSDPHAKRDSRSNLLQGDDSSFDQFSVPHARRVSQRTTNAQVDDSSFDQFSAPYIQNVSRKNAHVLHDLSFDQSAAAEVSRPSDHHVSSSIQQRTDLNGHNASKLANDIPANKGLPSVEIKEVEQDKRMGTEDEVDAVEIRNRMKGEVDGGREGMRGDVDMEKTRDMRRMRGEEVDEDDMEEDEEEEAENFSDIERDMAKCGDIERRLGEEEQEEDNEFSAMERDLEVNRGTAGNLEQVGKLEHPLSGVKHAHSE